MIEKKIAIGFWLGVTAFAILSYLYLTQKAHAVVPEFSRAVVITSSSSTGVM